MLVFAAETSCDETSICLMENSSIIEHITFSQEIHKIHGGVVPELASRSHLEKIQIMTNELFSRKNIDPNEIELPKENNTYEELLNHHPFLKEIAKKFLNENLY